MATKNYKLVCITGPIGVGKTTCAESLSRALGARRVTENLAANRYLKAFYQDMERYALATQTDFLLSRSRQLAMLASHAQPGTVFVADYHFAKERIFAQLLLKEYELAIYNDNYETAAEHVPAADAVVYLKASPATLLDNLRKRGRPYEQDISPAYVERVAEAYEEHFSRFDESPLVTVDADGKDFSMASPAVADIARRVTDIIAQAGT